MIKSEKVMDKYLRWVKFSSKIAKLSMSFSIIFEKRVLVYSIFLCIFLHMCNLSSEIIIHNIKVELFEVIFVTLP